MSEMYAIETETHTTTTHYIPYGKQLEGKYGRWTSSCGRYIWGEVWGAGSVDGVRCKNCIKRETERQQLQNQIAERRKILAEKSGT